MSQNGELAQAVQFLRLMMISQGFLRKPKPIITERKRSFDEKSFSKMSITMSPRPFYRNTENSSRVFEPVDSIYSSGGSSGFDTPRSDNGFETHPIISEAWEALRQSMVYFRNEPVGTIAATDHSEDMLNYDQGLKRLKKFQPGRRFGKMVPRNHIEYNRKSDIHLKDGKLIGLRDIPHKGSIVPVSIKVKRAAGEGPSIRHREHPSSGRFH